MTLSWKELGFAHRNPAQSDDPQRTTLRARAIAQVDEGLRHLESVGLRYQVVPKGESVELPSATAPTSLSLSEAIDQASTKH